MATDIVENEFPFSYTQKDRRVLAIYGMSAQSRHIARMTQS
jgi:hypothetical protein